MVLIYGGRVVDPTQAQDGAADVLIENGKVAAVGRGLTAPADAERVDATGLVVVPGLIDVHVHLREPGQEYKETVESGSRAAAAGGFTAVGAMPNTRPVNDTPSVTEHMLKSAALAGYARVYPVCAVTKGLKSEELAEIGECLAVGAVAITDDGWPVAHPELMRRALQYARHFGVVLMQHAEDLAITGPGVMHEGEWSTRLGLPGIPGSAEDVCVARDLVLAEETGGRYHVQHLSSGRSLDLVRAAKARGVNATCEASPHHLLLTDEDVYKSGADTRFKMKPPVRSAKDREMLLEGLADGSIDLIASDHAPHHQDEKDLEFSIAPFGIVGLETTVSLCLDRLVRGGLISLSRLVELLSTNPAKVLGVPGGSLRPGSVADITLLDLEKRVKVNAASFKSKSRNTPFDGWELVGAPAGTFLSGRRVVV